MIPIKEEKISDKINKEYLDIILSRMGPYKHHIKFFDPKRGSDLSSVSNAKDPEFTAGIKNMYRHLSGDTGNWAFVFRFDKDPIWFTLLIHIYKKGEDDKEKELLKSIVDDILKRFPLLKRGKDKKFTKVWAVYLFNSDIKSKQDVFKAMEVVRYMYERAKRFGTLTGRKDV